MKQRFVHSNFMESVKFSKFITKFKFEWNYLVSLFAVCKQLLLAESILVTAFFKSLVHIKAKFWLFSMTEAHLYEHRSPISRQHHNRNFASSYWSKDHSRKADCKSIMQIIYSPFTVAFYEKNCSWATVKVQRSNKCIKQAACCNTPYYTLPLQASLTLSNISSDICLYPGSSLMHAACLSSPHS